jgi:hypothetical protein
MLHLFKTVVRSLLEYACPVWHNSLTDEQSDLIESIQKRAFNVKIGSSIIDYQLLYNLPTLSERRETVSRRCFEKSVLRSNRCLHNLLPSCRGNNIVAKLALRHARIYATPTVRIDRFRKSFIMSALNNYL